MPGNVIVTNIHEGADNDMGLTGVRDRISRV